MSTEKVVNHLNNLARRTPRRRTSATFKFNGVNVKVAASVLRKWEEIPEEQKVALRNAADEAVMYRLTEKPWRDEQTFYKSLYTAYEAIRRLFKRYRIPSDRGETMSTRREQDPVKLRNALKALKGAAKELCRRTDAIERPYSDNLFPELHSILGSHWSRPSGICLCWMSYPALAKFLSLTVPSLESLTAAALGKECQRLGLPKRSHPLVEIKQVIRDGNAVSIIGSSYHRAVNR